MFPIRDHNPSGRVPYVCYALIAINVAVWLLVQGAGSGERFIESRVTGRVQPLGDARGELVHRHAGVGRHDDFEDGFFASGQRLFHIPL